MARSGSLSGFALDRAVWFFGTQVELAMNDAEEALGPKAKPDRKKTTRLNILKKYLSTDGYRMEDAPGTFRDPAGLVRR